MNAVQVPCPTSTPSVYLTVRNERACWRNISNPRSLMRPCADLCIFISYVLRIIATLTVQLR